LSVPTNILLIASRPNEISELGKSTTSHRHVVIDEDAEVTLKEIQERMSWLRSANEDEFLSFTDKHFNFDGNSVYQSIYQSDNDSVKSFGVPLNKYNSSERLSYPNILSARKGKGPDINLTENDQKSNGPSYAEFYTERSKRMDFIGLTII
jgi:hypothetical protein